MKMKLAAVALAVAAAVSAPVKADVLGSTHLAISNFLLVDSLGGFFGPGDINVVRDNRNGTLTASLDGFVTQTVTGTATSGATLDMNPVCVGLCGSTPFTGNNDATTTLAFGDGMFSRSDMFVSGSALGIGASGMTRADSISGPTRDGSANSEITNNILASMIFTAGTTRSAAFLYNWAGFAHAAISNDLLGRGSSADASSLFQISVNGTNIESFSFGANAFDIAGFSDETFSGSGQRLTNFVNLVAGQNYNVVVSQTSQVNISALPEPGMLVLLGIGLLGAGLVQRQRKIG